MKKRGIMTYEYYELEKEALSLLMVGLHFRSWLRPWVPAACCSGINSLYNAAATTADRQAVCSCIKSAAKGVSLDVNRAAGVLSKCGVSVSYKISADMDCSKVE